MFDNRTLILGELLIPFAFIIIQLIEFSWSRKQYVKENIFTNMFQMTGYLFLLLYGIIPYNLSIGMFNILIVLSTVYMFITTYKLYSIRVPQKIFTSTILFLFIVQVYSIYVGDIIEFFYVVFLAIGFLVFYGVHHFFLNIRKKDESLIYLFIGEFILFGGASILQFFLSRGHESFFNENPHTGLYVVQSSLFILLWNYTVQLKRNKLINEQKEESSRSYYRLQEDLYLLNQLYYEKDKDYSLKKLYKEIIDLLIKRFSFKRIVLFINKKSGESVSEYSVGFDKDEISLIKKSINNRTGSEPATDFAGELNDGDYKDLILSKGLIGCINYPLSIRGNSLGSIFIGISSNSTIVNSEKDIILLFCRQFAGIIHNGQVFNNNLHRS